jgi:hypothetical protein
MLTLSLRSRLPDPGAQHCWVGGIHDHTLVIVTDSANWAVPIRYQQFELLKQINSEFQQNLKRLRIRVSNPTYREKSPANRPALSSQSAQQLASVAATIDDQGLKTALLRLASRVNQSPAP